MESNNDRNFNDLALAFRPLALKMAAKYAGRGAEFDDLLQEGLLALDILVSQWEAMEEEEREEELSVYVAKRFPGRVRDAAERSRWRYDDENFRYLDVPLEEIMEKSYDVLSEEIVESPRVSLAAADMQVDFDVEATLRRVLSDEEFWIVWWLMYGWTLREIARKLDIPHTTLHYRLKKIRRKLLPYLPMMIMTTEGPVMRHARQCSVSVAA